MLKQQSVMAALGVERRMYASLCEVMDLTEQLSDAIMRKDQVSVSLFLNLRKDQINDMLIYKQTLEKQCSELPAEDGKRLEALLAGREIGEEHELVLCEQVKKNRSLLERTIGADKQVSKRLGGKKSFYSE